MRMFRKKKLPLNKYKFQYKIGDKVLFNYSVYPSIDKEGKIIKIDDISDMRDYDISSVTLMVYQVKGEDGKIYYLADNYGHNHACYIIKKI